MIPTGVAHDGRGVDSWDEPGRFPADLGMCDPREDDRYLDVGTGLGTLARHLGPHVRFTVGVDLLPEAAAVLRTRSPAAHHVAADAVRLPFAGNAFTLATCRGLLHHVPAPGEVLAEIADAMCPGGCLLVVETAGREHPVVRKVRDEVERTRDPTHLGVLAPSRLMDLMEAAGFEVTGEERQVEDISDVHLAAEAGADLETLRGAIRHRQEYAAGFLALRWQEGRFHIRRERVYVSGVRR